MATRPDKAPVSAGNPCPFLRMMVAQKMVADAGAPIGELTASIVKVARTGDGSPQLPGAAIRAIALIANGLSPLQMARNASGGVRISELRNGPLDKKGVGSGILDASGEVVEAQLARLEDFASDKTDADGRTERGLSLAELKRMMDANFERAKGRRRALDRKLMDGEWPVLLQVLGKPGKKGRYLSLDDVRTLFVEQRLPARMTKRLKASA